MLNSRKTVLRSLMGLVLVVGLCIPFCAVGLTGCSGSSSSSNYSVAEYNSDVDHLGSLLSKAQSLDHQIDAMGDTNRFTTQAQVDAYNDLVNQYNSAAENYTKAAKAFSEKYSTSVDGTGSRPTDPDNIHLPSKK